MSEQSEHRAAEFVSAVRTLCGTYGAWVEKVSEYDQGGGLARIKIEINLKIKTA